MENFSITAKYKIGHEFYEIVQSSEKKNGNVNFSIKNPCICRILRSKIPKVCEECGSIYRKFHIIVRKINKIRIQGEIKYSKRYDTITRKCILYYITTKSLKGYPKELDKEKYCSEYKKSYWCLEDYIENNTFSTLEEAEKELKIFNEMLPIIGPIYDRG